MSAPPLEAVQRLIDAAAALLEAHAVSMVTRVEWDILREALAACGRTVEPDDAND